MGTTSTQSVKNADRGIPAARDVTVLNDAVINELARELIDEFLPHVDRVHVDPNVLESAIESFARDNYGTVAAAATFGKTVAIPNTPITIHSGGGLKSWAILDKGQVALPQPVLLDGFTVFGPLEIGGWTLFHGLAGVERLYAEDGQVYAGLCCIPFFQPNVTKEILNNPVAKRLFPTQEVGPVTLEQILELAKNPPADSSGPDLKQILLEALHEIALQIKFYQTQADSLAPAQSPLLSIRLFLNLPDLLQTIKDGTYRAFDFTGILAGSAIDWKPFPLYLLPRPENIYFSAESSADFNMSYDPRAKKTSLHFKQIQAGVFLLNWFTEKPMTLKGNIHVDIEAGGKTALKFEQLEVSFPNFPAENVGRNFATVSGTLNGNVFLHMDEEGLLKLDKLDLRVDHIHVSTPHDRRIGLGSAVTTITGKINGTLSVSFNTQSQAKLRLNWETQGEAELISGRNRYDVEGMSIEGNLLGQISAQKYHPQLDGSSLYLGAKHMTTTGGSLALLGPWLRITGGDRAQKGGTVIREALLQAGAEALIVGDIPLKPSLYLELSHHSSAEKDELVGFGAAALKSESLPLQIQSRAHFRADDDGYAWGLDFDEPQIAGPLVASGRLRVGRHGTWAEADSVRSFSKFSIHTDQPYSIDIDDKTVARDVSVQGTGDDRFIQIIIDAGSLPAKMRAHLVVLKSTDNPRLSGQYLIARDLVTVTPDMLFTETEVSGNFVTVPLRHITDRPAARIREGKIKTTVGGGASGPIHVDYEGSLSYDPKTRQIRFSFDPSQTSAIHLGPLQDNNNLVSLDGHAKLEGTIAARLTRGTPYISGQHLGLHDGQVFIILNPAAGVQPSQRLPFLDKFWLSADRFTSDLESIQLSGDGLGVSTDIYLNPLGLRLGNGARKRSVSALGITRLPLSDPQYWPVLKEVSQTIQSATTGATQ